MKLISFLNDSNILVALAAASLTAGLQFISGVHIHFLFIAQSFFLTWVAYLFLKINNMPARKTMVYASTTGATLCLLLLDFFGWQLLLIAGLFVVIYKADLLRNINIPKFPLRQIPLIKSIAIGFCWTIITTAIPALAMNDATFALLQPMIFSNFLFVTALAMAGDIRDASLDTDKLKTLPVMIGISWTKTISILLLIAASYLFSMTSPLHTQAIAILFYVMMGISALMVLLLDPKKDWQRQAFLIDGVMVARFIAIAIAAQL